MAQFLQSERVNCENLKHFLLDTAHRLKWHAEQMAAQAGRPQGGEDGGSSGERGRSPPKS